MQNIDTPFWNPSPELPRKPPGKRRRWMVLLPCLGLCVLLTG